MPSSPQSIYFDVQKFPYLSKIYISAINHINYIIEKISITHSPTDNFKSRDASASNKSRDASASKKPKTDTLDALGDAITTILATNLDNNIDNQS